MTDRNSTATGKRTLFSELRRRRVFRSTALYVAAAWVLLQVVSVVFPIFDIDDDYQRYVTIALFAGFPVCLVLSWLFDLDFGKVTRTDTVEPTLSDEPPSTAEIDVKTRIKAFPLRSVAVMPFANVGGNTENEFFSDGIAEELINLLSKSRGLNVAARTSSFSFKGASSTVQDISSRLGVRHILEGSVRREQSRVRISVQLIDALSGFQVWSSSYDRELTDIFAVQDDISTSIVDALSAAIDQTMGGTQSLRPEAPTGNMEAYQLYLRGMYLWRRRGAQALTASISALEQAVDLDPHYVDAIALLAVATAIVHEYTGSDREPDFKKAESYAGQALKLAPETSMAHAVNGYIAVRRWQWEASEAHYKRAINHDASDPLVHQWYSNFLNDLGLHELALVHALKAHQADRLSPQANNILALNFLLLGDNESAVQHVSVAREFGIGGAVPDWVEYFVRLRERKFDAAAAVMRQSLQQSGASADWVQPVVNAIADEKTLPDALSSLTAEHQNGTISTSLLFMQYVLLGTADEVFEVANTQLANHSLIHLWLFLDEATALRSDPRFKTLMTEMSIVAYWEKYGYPTVMKTAGAQAL